MDIEDLTSRGARGAWMIPFPDGLGGIRWREFPEPQNDDEVLTVLDGNWISKPAPSSGGVTMSLQSLEYADLELTPGQIPGFVIVPFAGTINGIYLAAGEVGDIVMDVWKAAANTVPTVADTIFSAGKPTLAAEQFYTDTTLTGVSLAVAEGDVFAFNIDSTSGLRNLTLTIRMRK